MKLSGSYQINLKKQKVWEALNNPEILKQAIPGCEEFTKNSDTEFTAKATNKIGPFNATFTGDIELKELNPPNSYKISGSGNSPVGFASGQASVKLEDQDNATKLIYEVEANVGGKIAYRHVFPSIRRCDALADIRRAGSPVSRPRSTHWFIDVIRATCLFSHLDHTKSYPRHL